MSEERQHQKVGLALGGGAARGGAHIGIIRALEERGIHIDFIAGTSIGSMVGAAYCAGNLPILEDVVQRMSWQRAFSLLDVVFPSSGLISGTKVSQFISETIGKGEIAELAVPFAAVATDLASGAEIVFGSGDLVEAVRASISIPGIFRPVFRGEMILVDGGLVNPVPVSAVRSLGADFIIAVDLNLDVIGKCTRAKKEDPLEAKEAGSNPRSQHPSHSIMDKASSLKSAGALGIRHWVNSGESPRLADILMTSFNVMEAIITTTRFEMDRPDVIIKPKVGHIKLLEFHRMKEAAAIGYREAVSELEGLVVPQDK